MNEIIQTALNEQIKSEFYSSYFYLSASGYLDSMSLSGFARWMRAQYQEEVAHAMKFFDFMLDRGSRPILQGIDKPPANFQSPLDVFTQALQHERQVTSLIHRLYALTVQEKDYPAQVLLQWFISEQVEEERAVSKITEELKMAGDNSSTLLLLNNTLGAQRLDHGMPVAEGVTPV
jgi:ferritin